MDSLTQIALGAAIGETVAGEKAKNRAMFWGGIAGLVPDLDVVLRPLYSQSAFLLAHRGFSHSFVFAILFSPLLAALAYRIHGLRLKRPNGVSYFRWWLLIFIAIFTHPLLDIMTIYGTGFLEPFSNARLAIGNINIIDPIYSLPLIVSLIVIARARKRVKPKRLIAFALIFTHLYLFATFVNLLYIENLFKENLSKQNIQYKKFIVSPSFLNNILWSGAAVGRDHVWVGQYSHLDPGTTIRFQRKDRNLHLAETVPENDYKNLVRFSKGYFSLRKAGDSVIFHDLRFGVIASGQFVFDFDFGRPEESPFGRTVQGIDSRWFISRLAGNR